MNRFKKITKYFGIIIVLIILFRGFLYRTLVNYSKIGIRNNIALTNKKLINEIGKETKGKTLNINEIMILSSRLTSENLEFTFNKVSNNPNSVYELKKANCIGYSALFNSIGNFIIKKQDLTNRYEFNHLIGKLDFFGFNVHDLFNSPFFKNHDFNEIKDKQTGKKKFVDPSMRDYLRIEYVKSE